MKVLALILCACVVGSYATNLPLGVAQRNVAAVDLDKLGKNLHSAGDKVRSAGQAAAVVGQQENVDIKKSSVAQEWAGNGRKSASDSHANAQDWRQNSGDHQAKESDGARRKAQASNAAADQKAAQRHNANYFADKNNNWAGKQGFRKGNRRHEGISYAFDKNFRRNANENGGFDAGSSLADHALDDVAARSSNYGRWVSDHGAGAHNADRQSANRKAGWNNAAWANKAASDKFGRDADQASGANGNARDWAEKRDNSLNRDNYHETQGGRAFDALNDNSLLDRNARRQGNRYGAGRDAKKGYGAEYGYGAPYGYGVAGKGYDRANGAADRSSVWDNAHVNKNQKWAGDAISDRAKDSALANQWQQDKVNGFNTDERAALHDAGFAQDAAARNEGARADNDAAANARAAHQAGQARHDFDEDAFLAANKKWKQSDRDHKFKEYKKFFNNDQKGGKNFERLKYDRAQTDDSAAADFDVARDDSSAWRDAHRLDAGAKSARHADEAWADNAHRQRWAQDGNSNAAGAQQQNAEAADAANRGRWGSDADRRRYDVEQLRRNNAANDAAHNQYGGKRAGADSRIFGRQQNAFGKAGGSVYPAYNNYGGYGAGYGPGYGAGYGAGYGNYGGYGGYGNFPKFTGNYGGYGRFPNKGYGYH